jgi:hypothetical protein
MAFLHDSALDSGLSWIDTNASRLDICSSEPTTYAEATSTYTLGNKTGINPDAPADRTGGGRQVTIPAITDGSVTGDGTAAYWALTNGSDTLIATNSLSSSQGVSNGNTFTLTSFEIGIPDAT